MVLPTQGVPTLILPNGTKLIESMAIIEYLNEAFPEPNNLFPGNAEKRAHIRGLCEVINSGIHPYVNLRLLEKIDKDFGASRKEWATFWLKQGLTSVESLIKEHNKGEKFIFGKQITCADVLLYPQVYNAKSKYDFDLSEYPNIHRIFDSLSQVKEIQDASPQNQKDFE
jgi:maleylacetoacetate isomerase